MPGFLRRLRERFRFFAGLSELPAPPELSRGESVRCGAGGFPSPGPEEARRCPDAAPAPPFPPPPRRRRERFGDEGADERDPSRDPSAAAGDPPPVFRRRLRLGASLDGVLAAGAFRRFARAFFLLSSIGSKPQ